MLIRYIKVGIGYTLRWICGIVINYGLWKWEIGKYSKWHIPCMFRYVCKMCVT